MPRNRIVSIFWGALFLACAAFASPLAQGRAYSFNEYTFRLDLPADFTLVDEAMPSPAYKRFGWVTPAGSDGINGVIQVGLFDLVKMNDPSMLEAFAATMIDTMRRGRSDFKVVTSDIELMGLPAKRAEWTGTSEVTPGRNVTLWGVMLLGISSDRVAYRLEAQDVVERAAVSLPVWERGLKSFNVSRLP